VLFKGHFKNFLLIDTVDRFVTALVSASSTDRTDRWTEWANWTACSVNQCGEAGLRTRRRVCVSTTGAVCTPGTARATEPCLGGGLACAAAARALTKISCLVGSETKQQLLNKTYISLTYLISYRDRLKQGDSLLSYLLIQ